MVRLHIAAAVPAAAAVSLLHAQREHMLLAASYVAGITACTACSILCSKRSSICCLQLHL